MSCSPERISSYRRHFEDSSSMSYQVRVSSPSPTRRSARYASAGCPCRPGASSVRVESLGRRPLSAVRRTGMVGAGVRAGPLVCVGPNGETAIDLNVAAVENQEFLNTRASERQEMVVLNDRLAVYINKVRSLEQQNKLLEAEIEAYQNRFEKPTGLRLLYEEQLKELKKIADQMRVQRDISLAAQKSTAAQLEALKIKYEESVQLRKKAELDIEAFRPDVDKATSSRIILEKKLEQLEVEIEFLKRVHQQEIDELMKQIYSAHVSAQSAFSLPDLAAALKQIQTQYDNIAAKNLQEMDSWYKNKFEDLTNKTSRHVNKVRSIREEIASAKKDIQSKERDLDALRTRNDALEVQIRETQEKHRKELEDLQAQIEALQLELKSTKEKIALHLREYQDLLNAKMSLEIEITTYRKLVEGEDLRLAGMMQTLSMTGCKMSPSGARMSPEENGGDVRGSMGGGVGMGGGTGAGGVGTDPGSVAGGSGERMGAGGSDEKKAGGPNGADMGVGHGLGTEGMGAGRGVGAGGLRDGGPSHGAGGQQCGNSVGGDKLDAVDCTAGSGGININGGNDGAGRGSGDRNGGGKNRVEGKEQLASTGKGGRIGGGTGAVGGDDVGALSGAGIEKFVGGMGGIRGARTGCESSGCDAGIDAYGEQAVELTERRTVLIRTVKNMDDVLEVDHQEQTYTITGAADDDD